MNNMNNNMNNNNNNNNNEEDIPLTYILYTITECKERYHACNVLGLFIEELADLEILLGNKLTKVGSRLDFSKVEWLTEFSICWDSIFRTVTSVKGNLHHSLAATLSSNLGKPFPDHAKINNKKLVALSEKITIKYDELKRAKTAYNKSYEKYVRSFRETEATISSRDAAIVEQQTQSSNQGEVVQGGQTNYITNLFNKMAPNADYTKKLNDRCIELIRNLNTNERDLSNTVIKLQEYQDNLINEIKLGIQDVIDLDLFRIQFTSEGIHRLNLAEDLLLQRMAEATTLLGEKIDSVDVDKEISIWLQVVDSSDQGKKDLSQNDSSDLFAKVEKLLESLEYLRGMSSKAMILFNDLSDIEKGYCKGILKAHDKHTNIQNPDNYCNITSQLTSSFSHIHAQAADNYCGKIMQILDFVVTRLDAAKLNLIEKQSEGTKRIERANATVSRNAQKLSTLRKTLNERRETLKSAKEGLGSQFISPDPREIIDDDDVNRIQDDDECESEEMSSAASDVSGDKKLGNPNFKGMDKLKRGFKKVGTNVLRATKLSVAVGLETPAERVTRIELQIQQYEKDEKELYSTLVLSMSDVDEAHDGTRKDILNAINSTKEVVCESLKEMKKSMQSFLTWKISFIELSRQALEILKDYQEIPNFKKTVREKGAKGEKDKHKWIMKFEDIEKFDPLYSEIIENEKKNYGWTTASSGDYGRRGSVASQESGLQLSTATSILSESQSDMDAIMIIPKMSRRRSKSFDDIGNVDSKKQDDNNRSYNNISMTDSNGDFEGIKSEDTAEQSLHKEKAASDPVIENKRVVQSVPVQIAPPQPVIYIKGSSAEKNNKQSQSQPQPQVVKQKVSPSNGSSHHQHNHNNHHHQHHKNHHDDSNVAEMMRFGLDEHDKVVESYTCALIPRKGLLTHGKMFITQNYIAFSGWPETRVLLAMELIESIEKQNTLMYIPNAISITTATEEYFFGSFIDRDPCYNLLTRLSAVKKKLVEINGQSDNEKRKVVLGLQTPKKLDNIPLSGVGANLGASIGAVVSGIGRDLGIEIGGDADSYSKSISNSNSNISHSIVHTILENNVEKVKSISEPIKFPETSYQSPPRKVNESVVVGSDIDVASLFYNEKKVIKLCDSMIKGSYKDFFNKLWQGGKGYESFLSSEGDLNISFDEWKPFNGTVAEDLNKIPFNYYRNFSYHHPRTTMLMFGPKNAPAKQIQYLYLNHQDGQGLPEAEEAGQFLVLTVTQFDGIPMAEFFKVLQYWGYTSQPNNNIKTNIGLHVHFIKTTLLKGQVASGVKDELTTLAKRWCTFAQNFMDCKTDIITQSSAIKAVSTRGGSAAPSPADVRILESKNMVTYDGNKEEKKGLEWWKIFFYLLLVITFIIIIASLHIHYKNDRRITELQSEIKKLSTQLQILNKLIDDIKSNSKVEFELIN